MAESLIRWNRSDYARLRSAVSQFNKKINELESITDDVSYLPKEKTYKDLKEHIVSRKELNRVIKSLRNFNNESSIKVETLGGQELTKWEYKELKRARQRALNNLAKEEGQIVLGRKSIGMGDERLQEIEATRKSFNKLETTKGSEFQRVASRIENVGRKDYKLAQDKQFMNNFYKAVKELKNFDNYDEFMKHLSKIKNPTKFYEYITQNSTIMSDLFKWYKDDNGTIIYGGFASNQDAFNTALEKDFGIDLKV